MTDERYGRDKLGKDYQLQDYPFTYDEIEPYYTKFELAIGVAGEPGHFGGRRSKPYPMPPLVKTPVLTEFERAARETAVIPT